MNRDREEKIRLLTTHRLLAAKVSKLEERIERVEAQREVRMGDISAEDSETEQP